MIYSTLTNDQLIREITLRFTDLEKAIETIAELEEEIESLNGMIEAQRKILEDIKKYYWYK